MTAPDPRTVAAPAVSAEARSILEPLLALILGLPPQPLPSTQEEYDRAAVTAATLFQSLTASAVAALAPDTSERNYGGVPVLDVRPRGWRDDGSVLVYVHGGAFVQGSARSAMILAALMADRTGRRVVSVDYTLAPRATYDVVTDQVAAVHVALLDDYPAGRIGLTGDSAGGGIAASTLHKLRDRGVALPAASVLLSPVTDLAAQGDSFTTLAGYDMLSAARLGHAYRAYAPGDGAFGDPYASPLFGDFAAGYPPVLIQVGTREVLLSDSVRLHRAIRAAGGIADLDVYEGMPHVFEQMVPDAPEGRQAWSEIDRFWRRWIPPRDGA